MRRLTILWLVLGLGSTVAGDPRPPRTESAGLLEHLNAKLLEADRAVIESRLETARMLYDEAASGAKALGESNLIRARAIDGQGDVQRLSGRFEAAEESYMRSSALWKTLLGENQPRLATTLQNLGAVRLLGGDCERAQDPLRRALVIWEQSLGAQSPPARQARAMLATCFAGTP